MPAAGTADTADSLRDTDAVARDSRAALRHAAMRTPELESL